MDSKASKYIIYDHISPSGKHYIGQTISSRRRWGRNGRGYLRKKKDGSYFQRLFARAILKYGWDNFEHKILFENLSKQDADLIEKDLIYYYKKLGKSYNMADGGEGGNTWEHKGEKCCMYGKHLKQSTKDKLSKILGRPVSQFKDSKWIANYNSASAAGKATGIDSSSIIRVCNGVRKSAGKYVWKWQK